MKVYYHGRSTKHRLFVQPGVDHPESSEWMEAADHDGKRKPKLFDVIFENGIATVDDNLGKYLITKGLANKSKFILPANAEVA